MKQRPGAASVHEKMILAAAFALVLALMIVPTQATAQVVCPTSSTADFDGDGFTDAQECAGITLVAGNALLDGTTTSIGPCSPGVSAADRPNCVDPNSRDAFVIVTRATPTKIPSNPYQFFSAFQSAGGLGITIHEISTTRTDRKVTNQIADGSFGTGTVLWPQLAARLVESLQPADPAINDVDLGRSNQGMALDLATVFTQRIIDFVNSVCVAGTTCVDSNVPSVNTAAAVIDQYIRHTIAHELGGHVLTLAPVYNSRFGGNHYQSGTNVVMEQSVKYTKKGTKVTWYISTLYTDPDRAGVKLQ